VLRQPWADLTACQCNMYMSPKCATRQPVETSMFKQPPPAILLPTWVRSRVTGSCLYTWQPPMGKVRLKLMREPSGSRLGWAVVRDPGTPSPYCTCSRQQQSSEAAARAGQPSCPLLLVGELRLASQHGSLGWSAASHKPPSDTCSTSRSCNPLRHPDPERQLEQIYLHAKQVVHVHVGGGAGCVCVCVWQSSPAGWWQGLWDRPGSLPPESH
jgi:hypothetical protein